MHLSTSTSTNTYLTPALVTTTTTTLVISSRMEFQYRFQQMVDHVSFRALAMPSCFVSWIPIGHCFQRDHPLNLRPNLLWSASYYGIYHVMGIWKSTLPVKCQRPERFIVNVKKPLFWRKLLFSLLSNITNNTNFYCLKTSFTYQMLCNWAPNRTCHPSTWHIHEWLITCLSIILSYKVVYMSICYVYKRIYHSDINNISCGIYKKFEILGVQNGLNHSLLRGGGGGEG